MPNAGPALVAVRISRRRFVAAAPLILFWHEVRAEEPATPFADWVNTLYVGAVILREAAGGDGGLSDQDIQGLFTPEVQALRDTVKDRTLPPSELEGPILDILFGWGALPRRRIEILSVIADAANQATVDLTIDGHPRLLVLTGKVNEEGKTWQIDDIDYGAGGPDQTLRERLERMKSWPKR
jgi:hypothetical protein